MIQHVPHEIHPTWKDRTPARLPRVMLLAHAHPQMTKELIARVQTTICSSAELVHVDLEGSTGIPPGLEVDFAVVLGGDGSILRAAQSLAPPRIPVLGVNLGKLGFLADVSLPEIEHTLPEVCQGNCHVVAHLMLDGAIHRGKEVLASHLALNEVAIHAGPPYSLLDIELRIDGSAATVYSCDGILVSTPVGSTAHSLSAGGPIVRKDLQAFVICPIGPHTLTVRPLVDSADRVIELLVRQPHEATAVVVDGRMVHRVEEGDRVVIRRAEPQFLLIEVAGRGYYRTLREKLGWAGQMRRRRP